MEGIISMSDDTRYKTIKIDDDLIHLFRDVAILKQNVLDLQSQLQSAYIRIAQLTDLLEDYTHDSNSEKSAK